MSNQHTQFYIGGIVYLNSASPELKITAIKDQNVEVEWRNERGDLERTEFPKACVH
jgi:hypothetical protein